MELPFLLLICAFAGYCLFMAGRASKEYPDEDEMIRRLKELRYNRKLKTEAHAEVDELLRR